MQRLAKLASLAAALEMLNVLPPHMFRGLFLPEANSRFNRDGTQVVLVGSGRLVAAPVVYDAMHKHRPTRFPFAKMV